MEYDDITLMMYADGELDKETSDQLKIDLLTDPILKKRLHVFTSTREALLNTVNKNDRSIPDHIINLIDSHSPNKNEPVTPFKSRSTLSNSSKNKRKIFSWNTSNLALAASLTLGVIIGSKGLPFLMTDSETEFNFSTRGYQSVKHLSDIKPTEPPTLLPNFSSDKYKIVIYTLLESLSTNPTKKIITVQAGTEQVTIKILSNFINQENKQCKLAEFNKKYLITCLSNEGKWTILEAN
jgi:hypothetical protein